MTSKTFAFELISPESVLVSEPAVMAVIPGEMGELGVGAGHAPFIVSLKPGVVRLYQGDDKTPDRRIFIAGGFADITGTSVRVLAEEAMDTAALDLSALDTALKTTHEDLKLAKEQADKERLEKRLAVIEAKLDAITHNAKH